ncbi:c-type cytochrome [Rubripirellula sp.]|nr:c-type cytochrome [Rubripirellula sp.]
MVLSKLMRYPVMVLLCTLTSSACFAQKTVVHTAEQPLAALEAARTMAVPEGVRVTLFAGEPDVQQPIGFTLDDRGRMWVVEAYSYPVHSTEGRDRIVILEDSDGDGRHDQRTVFYDRLNYVSGIEVGFGGVWVMSPPFMYFIPDRNGDDIPDAEPKVLLDGFGTHANAHNIANGFAWGPDGWLYATHGRTNWSMIGRPGDDESQRRRFDGGVWRYHPVRDIWEPYADGTTNPWGIDWNDYGDAFVCNCVNPHLFQVIQGAHYEPWRGRVSSQYAYQRIGTIADHLHFVGLGSVRNGLGSDAEDAAGGGHAHCGTMIYLGDQFPASYRNQLFTNNIHGRRVNNDLLRQSGSGYVASHGADLMRSFDPWFMGVTLACGPSGEIYVSDWSDTGECHSTRNTRRHTGRIYRLTYLQNQLPSVDLRDCCSDELVALQLDDNDWKVRHARRLLQERAAAGGKMEDVHRQLKSLLRDEKRTAKRLRALWALHVTDGLLDAELIELLGDEDPNLRLWAVTFLCEDRDPPSQALTRIRKLAQDGGSPRVRLAIASALQRLQFEHVWPIASALASRTEDVNDQNLPLMAWYAVEPLLADDPEKFAELATGAAIPLVAENMSRRITESSEHRDRGLGRLVTALPSARQPEAIMQGILRGLEGQRRIKVPPAWSNVYPRLQSGGNSERERLAMRLAMVFRDPVAIATLKREVFDAKLSVDRRRWAATALADNGISDLPEQLLRLLDDPDLRETSLKALRRYSAEETDREILTRYGILTDTEKQAALQTLASRTNWGQSLVQAIEKGRIRPQDVTAFTARQLKALGDPVINETLGRLWGEVRETPSNSAKQIVRFKKMLSEETLANADLARGEALFAQHCGKCHQFFGKGGNVGPDLTGAQRTNLDYLLENIVDPSASVANDYRMHVVRTVDGRIITGLVESESDEFLTVVYGSERVVIPKDEIEERKAADISVMPNGLLEPLSEREVRDLFGYLQK